MKYNLSNSNTLRWSSFWKIEFDLHHLSVEITEIEIINLVSKCKLSCKIWSESIWNFSGLCPMVKELKRYESVESFWRDMLLVHYLDKTWFQNFARSNYEIQNVFFVSQFSLIIYFRKFWELVIRYGIFESWFNKGIRLDCLS